MPEFSLLICNLFSCLSKLILLILVGFEQMILNVESSVRILGGGGVNVPVTLPGSTYHTSPISSLSAPSQLCQGKPISHDSQMDNVRLNI